MQKKTITKEYLAAAVSEKSQLTKAEAIEAVERFFGELTGALRAGQNVKLSGFGNFDLRDKKARPGLNPKTGEKVMVASRRVVTFQASLGLKNKMSDTDHAGDSHL